MDLGPRVVFTFGFGRDVTMCVLKGLACTCPCSLEIDQSLSHNDGPSIRKKTEKMKEPLCTV